MIFLYLILSLFNQQQYPLNEHKEPSTRGIEMYVSDNSERLVSEFQQIVGDSLYDIYIYTENFSSLSEHDTDYDTARLGIFFPPNEIIITNEEKFKAYELKDLSNYKRNTLKSANNFVKGTIFHELAHYYFMQVIKEMQMHEQYVSPEYNNFSIVPTLNYNIGARFIEEGICEYFNIKSKQSMFNENYYVPETINELFSKSKRQKIFYEYSVAYVRSFINYYGFKKGIQLIVSTKPPSPEQILYPDEFFKQFSFAQKDPVNSNLQRR